MKKNKDERKKIRKGRKEGNQTDNRKIKTKTRMEPDRGTTYPYSSHVLLLGCLGLAAELFVEPVEEVVHTLRRGNNVEGRRAGPSLLEEADP